MRILLVGPDHDRGSIPPYLTVLTQALRDLGATVHRLGSPGLPYDIDAHRFWPAQTIKRAARQLADSADLGSYDVISLHFGNLELEQLLPAMWSRRPRPPLVYHVHTLAPTLFAAHVPAPALREAVTDGLRQVDGLVHFGRHAAATFAHSPASIPSTVAWLPTTIPPGTPPALTPALERALKVPDAMPLVSLYGYAAPWKDPELLLAAADLVDQPLRVVLAGPGWDDPDRAGTELRNVRLGKHRCAELLVVPDYLDAGHRLALAAVTGLAVFPYRHHPSFQGSGAIADYLAAGVPVLATEVANMAELIGAAGTTVPVGDPAAMADQLRRLTRRTDLGLRARAAAQRRATQFTAERHARRCLALYERVAERARTGART